MFRSVVFSALVAIAASTPVLPRLDGRIVGGRDANIQDYPYQLSLQAFGRHICGASIISSKWALTAAHCTDGSSPFFLTIKAGITNQDDAGQCIKICKIHQHPRFDIRTLDWDISVLELATKIRFGSKARPIAMAPYGSEPFPGIHVVVTGWGDLQEGGVSPNRLQTVALESVDRYTCCQINGGGVTDRMICAGELAGGKGPCHGDSGGPLVAGGKLVGIVSWGYGCARPNSPGVFTNVGYFRSYIKQVSGL